MHTIYDPNFNLKNKLKSLGFSLTREKENEDIYEMKNDSDRYENFISVYIHHDYSKFRSEATCSLMSVFVYNNNDNSTLIYQGMRPYTEEQFYHIFSSILPSKEYVKKLQDALLENEYLNKKSNDMDFMDSLKNFLGKYRYEFDRQIIR